MRARRGSRRTHDPLGWARSRVAYAVIWTLSPNLAFEAPRWTTRRARRWRSRIKPRMGWMGNRRAGRRVESPLGEVVDHACDALSMCIYPLIVMDIFGVGHRSRDARRDLYDDDDDGRAMFVVDTVSSTFTGVLPVSRIFGFAGDSAHLSDVDALRAFLGSNAFLYAPITVPFVGATTLGRAGAVFCITTGAISRVGTFVNTVLKANKKEAPPHWPAYGSRLASRRGALSSRRFTDFACTTRRISRTRTPRARSYSASQKRAS